MVAPPASATEDPDTNPASAIMKLTPKRAVAIFGGTITLVSLARVIVLFLEALSSVRDERSQDAELLDVCASGVARGSMKMRAACLQAQADRASPVVLKAILRAVSTAFTDFSDSVSSPGKLLVVVLFVVSSLFLPIQSWIRALTSQDDGDPSPHIVVLQNDVSPRPRLGFRSRVAGALKMRRKNSITGSSSNSFDVECDTGDCMLDTDLSDMQHCKWE